MCWWVGVAGCRRRQWSSLSGMVENGDWGHGDYCTAEKGETWTLGQGVGTQRWWHQVVGSGGGTCGHAAMNLGTLITTWCLKKVCMLLASPAVCIPTLLAPIRPSAPLRHILTFHSIPRLWLCKTLLYAWSLPTPHAIAVAIMTVIGVRCASLSWLQMVVNVVFQVGPSVIGAVSSWGWHRLAPISMRGCWGGS